MDRMLAALLVVSILAVWVISDRLDRLGKMLEYWLPKIYEELQKRGGS